MANSTNNDLLFIRRDLMLDTAEPPPSLAASCSLFDGGMRRKGDESRKPTIDHIERRHGSKCLVLIGPPAAIPSPRDLRTIATRTSLGIVVVSCWDNWRISVY